MQFTNNFKVLWWMILLILNFVYLYFRFPFVLKLGPTSGDIIVYFVWQILCFAPIFKEMEIGSIKIKQQIEEAKKEAAEKLDEIRREIKLNLDVSSRVTQQISLSPPPRDSELKNLEDRIRDEIKNGFGMLSLQSSQGLDSSKMQSTLPLNEDVIFLFSVRYALETSIRRIVHYAFSDDEKRRFMPVHSLLNELSKHNIIPDSLVSGFRDVNSICSYAIHGEIVSSKQVSFVKDVAPPMISGLQTILGRYEEKYNGVSSKE